jgi:N-methylhydantoinase A/oxoprolinase/acetone carboxylase beta subunit
LLSGPVAGVRAAAVVAKACGLPDAVSFDMGGTSTDVCLIRDGVPDPAPTLTIAGYPIRLTAVAVHTIGAGGGSIARLDNGGAFVVGPHSAGAWPGPACYGRGGEHATVTDADVVLGRIPADTGFAALGRIDAAAARRSLDRAGVTAEGVVAVVDAAMERAVRVVTVEQGVDPRDLALVAFGGAGPLHACGVADALGMRAVIVPPHAGVFSAIGLVSAPRARELVTTWATPASVAGLDGALDTLALAASAAVGGAELIETFVDCRYVGQSHELTVRRPADFGAEHERRNGYARPGAPVEVVAIRARASRAAPLTVEALPTVVRPNVKGPQVVIEPDSTVWVPDGWVAEPGALGAWLMVRA